MKIAPKDVVQDAFKRKMKLNVRLAKYVKCIKKNEYVLTRSI